MAELSFLFGAVNILIGLLLLSSPATTALAVPFVFCFICSCRVFR